MLAVAPHRQLDVSGVGVSGCVRQQVQCALPEFQGKRTKTGYLWVHVRDDRNRSG